MNTRKSTSASVQKRFVAGKPLAHGFSSALLWLVLSFTASAQSTTVPPESPSTVQATYVDPSATRALQPAEKVGQLYTRNAAQDYVLQRLTQRTYWVQRQYYGAIFDVGR